MMQADFEVFEPAKGFRVFVHPTAKFKTITISLYVHQPLGHQATAVALLPQVLRRGCKGLPDMRSIVVFLEDLYGASMGADVAKIGERQMVVFRFEVVNDRFAPKKIQALEKSLQFLWRMLSQPVTAKGGLRADYVAQEKENLKRLIEGMINERMSYAYERCIQEMCKDEPYARYEYGKLEEIDPITPKSLLQLHGRLLAEAPIDLFVSGDVEPRKVAALAKKLFKFGKRKIKPIPAAVVKTGNGALREHVEKLDVEQGKMVMGCRTGVIWGKPDTFPLVMYNGLLGAFPHSKLFANVREKEGLAYAVHSSLDHTKGLLFVTAGIDPAKYTKCVEVIKQQMTDLAAGKISDDEWDKTRLTITDRVRSREDNPSAKIGSFLEMSLNGKPMTAAQVIDGVNGVSREQVVRAAALVRPDTIFYLTRP
ncbi:MAG TPA: pitrilysin family protein [Planctomycetota bacterium]|nr:pitrilysin family protein [Planctomycetota bacterium]